MLIAIPTKKPAPFSEAGFLFISEVFHQKTSNSKLNRLVHVEVLEVISYTAHEHATQ